VLGVDAAAQNIHVARAHAKRDPLFAASGFAAVSAESPAPPAADHGLSYVNTTAGLHSWTATASLASLCSRVVIVGTATYWL
jgi:hypothetical protein